MVNSRPLRPSHPFAASSGVAKTIGQAVVTCALAMLFVWLLSQRLADIIWAEVRTALVAVQVQSWLMATVATGISFWAVGQYDAVLHRHFATGLPAPQTQRAGICAIAISQTTGMGVITGAILRWRMLPGQSLQQALRLTIAVAVSFLIGWAVVTAAVLAALPNAPFKPAAVSILVLALALTGLCVLARPRFIRLPNGFTLTRLFGLCLIDTVAAGLAFYLLCPAGLDLTFAQLLPAFLLALGAGLMSGTPGGVGAFELTLFALLPAAAQPDLLAAVLAWRMIYYALPATMGAGLAIRGPRPMPLVQSKRPTCPTLPADRPHDGLAQQGHTQIIPLGGGDWLCARTPHFVIGLFDPKDAQAVEGLAKLAMGENRLPVIYHASSRVAVTARRLGYTNLRVAQEAWVCPTTFDLATALRAGLRRKLRRAAASGVIVTCADHCDPVPWQQLAAIAAIWAKLHGTERGFSMGRYSREYVQKQRLYIAWADARPVAFVTFHQTHNEWVLDLMRHGANPPDGIMHALIYAAIMDAARQNIARLSLAAVPDIGIGRPNGMLHRLISRVTRARSAGLVQFKSSFAPNWRKAYLAVPNRAALPLACAEIAREVFWPKLLPLPPLEQPETGRKDHHEEYEFASARITWQRRGE